MADNRQYTAIGHPAPPPATGYPVLLPNPNPNPKAKSSSSRHSKLKPDCCTTCVKILLTLAGSTFAVGIIFLLVIYCLVGWEYSPKFGFNSLHLSGLNLSTSSQTVSGNWTASFIVTNPNKKIIISYTHMHAYLTYRDHKIAIDPLPPFIQETNSATNITAVFLATSVFLEGPRFSRFVNDMNRGTLKFGIELHATAKYDARGRGWSFTLDQGRFKLFFADKFLSNANSGLQNLPMGSATAFE